MAIGVRELKVPVVIGFAWKTDLVGWTEGHPYQLRDEIRANAVVVVVDPFGSDEVTTLLSRLEKELGQKLVPDLRTRVREYSQGLPWLLKKFSDHVLRELRSGATQEQLLSEALNVQNLFQADLAELGPVEQEALKHIARYAPLPASEVTDRYTPVAIQSLVDRRLVVQVGERLDTYWDTFRDFLNTGRVPVEDSYILRQTPNSVARLLPLVVKAGGSLSVKALTEDLATSHNVIFNLSRELRLMGITAYEPNNVRLVDEIFASPDREDAVRKQVATALRRHRAYSTLRSLAERSGGGATSAHFAKELPRAFPAVAVKSSTWNVYGRVFLSWFAYAGLVNERGGRWYPRPDGDAPLRQRLLSERPVIRTTPSVPQEAPGVPIRILQKLAAGETVELPTDRTSERDAFRTLVGLGLVSIDRDRRAYLLVQDIVSEGQINPDRLKQVLSGLPGGAAGVVVLGRNPSANPAEVGRSIRDAIGAAWKDSSTAGVGGYFRSWAKLAGVDVQPVKRGSQKEDRTTDLPGQKANLATPSAGHVTEATYISALDYMARVREQLLRLGLNVREESLAGAPDFSASLGGRTAGVAVEYVARGMLPLARMRAWKGRSATLVITNGELPEAVRKLNRASGDSGREVITWRGPDDDNLLLRAFNRVAKLDLLSFGGRVAGGDEVGDGG